MTTPNVNVALAEQRLPLARRRSLVLALAGGAALASLPARAQSTAGGKGDILIGRSTALSGGMAPFLSPIHEGQEAAVEDANAKGGIGGRKIRLVSLDDGFDARRALDNAKQLSEKDGVLALFGVAGTSQVMTLLPYLAQAKLPLIGVYTGSPAIRAQQHPYLFTTRASYADELVKIVRNLVAVQTSRIAVAYENNDFGKLLLPLVEKTIAAEGAALAGSHALASSGEDANDAAKALATQKPQAVLLVAAALFLAVALKHTGLDKRIALIVMSKIGVSPARLVLGAMIALAAALLTRWWGQRAFLVGHSLGGFLSVMAAARYPQLARGVLLIIFYCLGLGLPFLLVALGSARAMRSISWARKHSHTIQVIGGVAMTVKGGAGADVLKQ